MNTDSPIDQAFAIHEADIRKARVFRGLASFAVVLIVLGFIVAGDIYTAAVHSPIAPDTVNIQPFYVKGRLHFISVATFANYRLGLLTLGTGIAMRVIAYAFYSHFKD